MTRHRRCHTTQRHKRDTAWLQEASRHKHDDDIEHWHRQLKVSDRVEHKNRNPRRDGRNEESV
jgi:hypothetical protein